MSSRPMTLTLDKGGLQSNETQNKLMTQRNQNQTEHQRNEAQTKPEPEMQNNVKSNRVKTKKWY